MANKKQIKTKIDFNADNSNEKTRTREKTLIKDAEVMNELSWQENHLKSIKHSYSKSPFSINYTPQFSKFCQKNHLF